MIHLLQRFFTAVNGVNGGTARLPKGTLRSLLISSLVGSGGSKGGLAWPDDERTGISYYFSRDLQQKQ